MDVYHQSYIVTGRPPQALLPSQRSVDEMRGRVVQSMSQEDDDVEMAGETT